MGKYQFRPTYYGAKQVPAETVASELTRIEQTGGLTAKRVVDAARPATAPLHPEFEWDNAKAAEAYREGQARNLIRSIEEIIEPKTPNEPREIRTAYVHVPARNPHQPGTYVPSAILAENVDQAQRALGEALRYLESAEKYVHFLRRLLEGKEDSLVAHLAVAHEGFHLIRTALEGLKAA